MKKGILVLGLVIAVLIGAIAAVIIFNSWTEYSFEVDYVEDASKIDSMITAVERENEKKAKREDYFMKTVSNTLNGTVFYNYGPDSITKQVNKLSITRYKDQTEFYRIFINNDTIKLGNTFKGLVSLYDDSKLYIWDEKKGQNVLTYHPKENNFFKYKVSPTKKGIYTFKGLIEVNFKGKSKNNPFEYKYVVIE